MEFFESLKCGLGGGKQTKRNQTEQSRQEIKLRECSGSLLSTPKATAHLQL